MHDDDIIVFDEDDLDMSEEEITLSTQLETENKNTEQIEDESKKEIFMDDMDDFSDFDDFNVQDLNDDTTNSFELKVDDIQTMNPVNFSKIDQSPVTEKKKPLSSDVQNMDYDDINQYLELEDDPSKIKHTEEKENMFDENIEYLDHSLNETLNEKKETKEKIKDMSFDEMNQSLQIETPKNETIPKTPSKFGKLINSFASKEKDKEENFEEMPVEKNDIPDINPLDLEKKEDKTKEKDNDIFLGDDLFGDKNFTPLDFDNLEDVNDDTYENEQIQPFETNHTHLNDEEIVDLIGDTKVKPDGVDEMYKHLYEKTKEKKKENTRTKSDLNVNDYMNDSSVPITPLEEKKKSRKELRKEKQEQDKLEKEQKKKEKTERKKNERPPKEKKDTKPLNILPILVGVLTIGMIAEGIFLYQTKTDTHNRIAAIVKTSEDQNNTISNLSTKMEEASSSITDKITEVDTKTGQIDEKMAELNELTEKIDVVNYKELINQVMPSIVSISSTSTGIDQSQYGQYVESERIITNGSGVIIDKNENEILILTNKHVIDQVSEISVIFNDGKSATATVKNTDNNSYLSLLSVNISDVSEDTLNNISIAEINKENTVELGDELLSIGNGLGYGQTTTKGMVSAVNKTLQRTDSTTIQSLIQTDTPIQPGNNGGAIIDKNGKLIGIALMHSVNTSDSLDNVGFVIPVSVYGDIISNLKNEQ